jgi:superfamily I DNA/RNA helicase
VERGAGLAVPEEAGARGRFFQVELPERAFNIIAGLPEEEQYDAMVIDEGQDFREEWFMILQGLLKGGEQGEFYIFADPAQTLFNADSDAYASFEVSRHCLTRNLRNTEAINSWLVELLGGSGPVATNRGGTPVGFFPWQSAEEELRLVTKELGRLVSQRVRPERVVILSPHVMDKSAFAGREKIGEWPLYEVGGWGADGRGGAVGAGAAGGMGGAGGAVGDAGGAKRGKPSNVVTFQTIRSFKGLEADIVFLTGIKAGSQACTLNDIYVGSSRGRFLLYIFHEAGYQFENKKL